MNSLPTSNGCHNHASEGTNGDTSTPKKLDPSCLILSEIEDERLDLKFALKLRKSDWASALRPMRGPTKYRALRKNAAKEQIRTRRLLQLELETAKQYLEGQERDEDFALAEKEGEARYQRKVANGNVEFKWA